MASITIVPVGQGEIEISCGGETIRLVVPDDAGSGEAKGKDSDDKGSDTPSTPTGGGSGSPTPEPVYWPPHIPLHARPLIGDLANLSFARLASIESLHALVTEFSQALHARSGQGPRHLVVTLSQSRIDIHELAQRFSHLGPHVQVTVILTREHA
jgi:hypothetical protein